MKKIYALIYSMRPHQWSKNGFLFPALIFSNNLFNLDKFILVVIGFILFSLVSGGIYIINDVLDYKKDALHPVKKKRPIPSGKIGRGQALGFAVLLLTFMPIIAYFKLSSMFFIVIVLYIVLQTAYSLFLKNIVLVDVFCIAAGFVMRILAGAYIIDVEISSWFVLCGFLLSLLIALGKRRGEIMLLGQSAAKHRNNLKAYTVPYLDNLILMVGTATFMTYSLYTMDNATLEKFHTDKLRYTIPFVLFGLCRYLYLVQVKKKGDTPETLIFKDVTLFITVLLYLLVVLFILTGLGLV